MKFFYLYIFLLICFIISMSYFNTYVNKYKENFNVDKQIFILLGDSIFKNDAYVSNGKSVCSLLTEKTNGTSMCLAIDNSKIIDIYEQIEKIPHNLNNNYTTIFISIGGNDILTYYDDRDNDINDTAFLGVIFTAYKKVITCIRDKLPNSNIVLLDIYYPDNLKYKKYHHIINEWNNKIYDYAKNSQNNILSVFKISNILTKKEDFSFDYEPSSTGGKKLVDTIISSY